MRTFLSRLILIGARGVESSGFFLSPQILFNIILIIFGKWQIFEIVTISKNIGNVFDKVNNLDKTMLIFASENSYCSYLSLIIKISILWKLQEKL